MKAIYSLSFKMFGTICLKTSFKDFSLANILKKLQTLMNSKFCTWRRINMIKNFGRKFSIIKFSLSIIINIKNSAFIKKNKKLTANFKRSSINLVFLWKISYNEIGLEKNPQKTKT